MIQRRAFTLVELLVVVTIIVILIAMLVPGLEHAKAMAERTKCAANLKGIGLASSLYLQDNKQMYPQINDWSGVLGNLGDSANYSGTTLDVPQRPYNVYLGFTARGSRVPIAECPSDNGDALAGVNAYANWGNSYLPAVGATYYRTAKVFGWAGGVPGAKSTQLVSAHSKMILTDWPWHANRLAAYERTRWHNPDKVREFNSLFSDAHAQLFEYPLDLENYGAADGPNGIANPSNGWW